MSADTRTLASRVAAKDKENPRNPKASVAMRVRVRERKALSNYISQKTVRLLGVPAS